MKKTASLSISYSHDVDFLAILSWLRHYRQAKVLPSTSYRPQHEHCIPQVRLIKARAFLARGEATRSQAPGSQLAAQSVSSELDSPGLPENSRDWSFNRGLSGKDTRRTAMIRKQASAPRGGADLRTISRAA